MKGRVDLLMMHRNKIQRSILPINMRDQLAYLSLQLRTIAQRRTRHLDQHHIPNPLRVLRQQLLKRAELDKDNHRIENGNWKLEIGYRTGERGRGEREIAVNILFPRHKLKNNNESPLSTYSALKAKKGQELTFCKTPLTMSSLSRPTIIFFAWYSARSAWSLG